ncbi:vitamin B12-binding protein [Ligilactobacillus ruminis]|nr:vitamin B12-binding protein [Ligilactobacillus ruminis]
MICENASFARNRGLLLRANLRNRCFARNRGLPFTGKSQKSTFCP